MESYETFFNIIRAPEGKEEEVLKAWKAISDLMEALPGCLSTKLHRSRNKPRLFINYARFSSEEAFLASVRSEDFQKLSKVLSELGVEREAGLYDVVHSFGQSE